MQEEVEQRIVSLMISCGKLGEQEFRKAVAKLLEQLKNGHQKHQYQTLLRIQEIVHDETLDDAECFQRIEEIVCAYEAIGSGGGSRHDF